VPLLAVRGEIDRIAGALQRVLQLLAQVGLKGFADKRPWQLSGGMLQRASLCRALIHEPQLLLQRECNVQWKFLAMKFQII
jgi:ABC-type nitrate/sulfonate/bicarbonate transport system ATPase subunit